MFGKTVNWSSLPINATQTSLKLGSEPLFSFLSTSKSNCQIIHFLYKLIKVQISNELN